MIPPSAVGYVVAGALLAPNLVYCTLAFVFHTLYNSNFAESSLTLWNSSRNVGEPVSARFLKARPRDPTCWRDPTHSTDALRATVRYPRLMKLPLWQQVWMTSEFSEVGELPEITRFINSLNQGLTASSPGPQASQVPQKTSFMEFQRNTNFSAENKSEHQQNSLQQLLHKGAEFSLTKGTITRTMYHGCWKGPQSSG
ncbi:hypothetical protein MDA_GLEAN10023879 [Myotis davidii]|uniref:Uncharacterized protein n=1 Tax=Myotis davidii TaxID=225400 RepID=L5LMH6_MYODS|nr:hypothetical protein MDA_GLEAN10023879 [Myotis davidii]